MDKISRYRLIVKYAKKKSGDKINPVEGVLLGSVGATAGSSVGVLGGQAIIGNNIKNLAGPESSKMPEFIKRDVNKYKKQHGLSTRVFVGGKAHPASIRSPFYSPTNRRGIQRGVHLKHPTNPGIVLHELGHAADFKKGLKRKIFLRKFGPGAGIIAGGMLLANEDTRKYAPAAIAAGFSPMLWQEGKASGSALKFLRKTYGRRSSQYRKAIISLGKAFGSYGAVAGGSALGVYGIGKLLSKTRNENNK